MTKVLRAFPSPEEAIISAVLVHPPCLGEIDGVPLHALSDQRLRVVLEAARMLRAKGAQCDLAAVQRQIELSDHGRFVGGEHFLLSLTAKFVTKDNLAYHVREVLDAAERRRLIALLTDSVTRIKANEDLDGIVADIDHRLAGPEVGKPSVVLAAVAAKREWDRALPAPITTGIAALDRVLGGGLRFESSYHFCGSTGRGKSGLVLQLCRHIGRVHPVLYLSSELTVRQVLARTIAPVVGTSWRDLFEAPPSRADWVAAKVREIAPRLRVHKLTRADNIRALAESVASAEGQVPVLVLDYLQHAARRIGGENVASNVAQMSDEITAFATELRGLAIIVSSVARGFYANNAERTATDFLGSAKHSGDVEYDSAGVFFLEGEPCPIGGSAPARLHIAKARFGGEGQTVGLRFFGALGLFEEDASNALPGEQRDAYELIRSGASSVEEVRAGMGIGKAAANALVDTLARKGVISRRPLCVIGGGQ